MDSRNPQFKHSSQARHAAGWGRLWIVCRIRAVASARQPAERAFIVVDAADEVGV